MHRKISVTALLYQTLYPKPTANDPTSFSTHLARNLIPEIRIETARFYGSLDSVEARYPGLNYTHIPHIRRLAHFPHHARLFRAIKVLGITDGEVLDMARWEGTLWARERFEKDEGIKVEDTTGDDIFDWVDPRSNKMAQIRTTKITTLTTVPVSRQLPAPQSATPCDLEVQEPDRATITASPEQIEDDSDTSEETQTPSPMARSASELSQQIMDVISRHQRGEQVNLSADLQDWVEELCHDWTSMQTRGSAGPGSLTTVREDILARISELQNHLPTTLNLASALRMLVEERMRITEPEAAVGAQASQVITQPAA
ncbi:Centromere protein I [Sphaceloma murrayae]|uniref:Centromere protein I n=1 Tax=Sphaceloma murrayae TaxID=2082308 RepID=A0A2K1QTA0_9PEZI|nr:Centromere protein I [Sphaceloma murrayae]